MVDEAARAQPVEWSESLSAFDFVSYAGGIIGRSNDVLYIVAVISTNRTLNPWPVQELLIILFRRGGRRGKWRSVIVDAGSQGSVTISLSFVGSLDKFD